jgi:hypothetical protein
LCELLAVAVVVVVVVVVMMMRNLTHVLCTVKSVLDVKKFVTVFWVNHFRRDFAPLHFRYCCYVVS